MTQLTHTQTELLKYLHSEIRQVSKELQDERFLLDFNIKWRETHLENEIDVQIAESDIQKGYNKIKVLEYKFEWLVDKLNLNYFIEGPITHPALAHL
jgi:hypothetical protein